MKFAICQEMFEEMPWKQQCEVIAEAGYTGIEMAPFCIAADPADADDNQLNELRRTAEDHGLQIIGLHWLLAKTHGLHLTSPDPETRRRTADYLKRLAEICARLGGDLMVFGSPQQRDLSEGISFEQGLQYATDVFAECMPVLEQQKVRLCFEPLTTRETNFIKTCAQAMELIRRVDHPLFVLHQDVKAMLGAETEPLPDLIKKYHDVCGHFHVNDTNLLGPGMGETDFHPIFEALLQSQYSGWISVEVFDYTPGAEKIAKKSMEYMQQVLRDVTGP